jgi:tRNA-splicing ligase RtcB
VVLKEDLVRSVKGPGRLSRVDDNHIEVANRWQLSVVLTANAQVPVEQAAVDELLSFLEIQETVERLAGLPDPIVDASASLERVALTPDFHRGSGIPIGTVVSSRGFMLPQAVGSDVNCGMRLVRTKVSADQVRSRRGELASRLRHVFFEGGRNIGLTSSDREALLRFGLPGLCDSLGRPELPVPGPTPRGGFDTSLSSAFSDWVDSAGGRSFDGMIGSIGGGNHFVEVQYVSKVLDGPAAYQWGLQVGDVVVMAHSGSLGFGHTVRSRAADMLASVYPSGVARPSNGVLPLPLSDRFAPQVASYLQLLHNAANFAYGNRFFLTDMVLGVLSSLVGDVDASLVYDAPHNLVWTDGDAALHRKGATPAAGPSDGSAGWFGEPVIVPGSMGSSSFVLRGQGEPLSLCSACHGAGRAVSRGAAGRADGRLLDEFLEEFTVVTPLDVSRPDVAGRRDLVGRWRRELLEEAPFAYKDVGSVVDSLRDAGVASPVVELAPLLTVKS